MTVWPMVKPKASNKRSLIVCCDLELGCSPLGFYSRPLGCTLTVVLSFWWDTCSFIQDYPKSEEYQPIKLELRRNELGKKNYQFDFSGFLNPFLVFSESALTALADILEPRGQLLPVITESKRKRFFGYDPTNPLSGCFDKEKSVYDECPNGFVVEKPFLIAQNITDDYLFSVEEDMRRVFVTDKFKQRVEDANLLGFDFSVETSIS